MARRLHALPPCRSALLWMAVVACTGDDADRTRGDDDDDDTPSVLAVTSAASPHVPSVVDLSGTVDAALDATTVRATATPSVGGQVLHSEVPAGPGAAFVVPVPGMVQGSDYDVVVEVLDPAGSVLASGEVVVTAPTAPPILGAIAGVRTADPIEPNYVVAALIGGPSTPSFVAIVDDQARVVWWKEAKPRQIIITPTLSRDGRSLLWGEYDVTKLEDTGTLYRVRLDGSAITSRRMELSHHAAVELPDEQIAWLGLDFRDVETSDGQVRRMATDTVYVGPEAYEPNPTELFNTFDDHPDPPSLTCEHMTGDFDRFDERDINEWTHGNSLAYVESEDALYLNAKQTDWVFKIDRSTGELLWQLGGIGGDFTYPDGSPVWTSAYDPTLFSHAHMSHVWEGGMVTFDNGDHRAPKVSSAVELAWDEQARTVERVWEFYHPGGQHTFALGDVRKLTDGTYLVGWGMLSEMMVVSAEHDVLWHVTVPPAFTIGRVLPLQHL